jgi:hypothetical protein
MPTIVGRITLIVLFVYHAISPGRSHWFFLHRFGFFLDVVGGGIFHMQIRQ